MANIDDDIKNPAVDAALGGHPGSAISSAESEGITNPALDGGLASRDDDEAPVADTSSSPEASGEGPSSPDNTTEFSDDLRWAENRLRDLSAETERLGRLRLEHAAQLAQGPRSSQPRPPAAPSYEEDPAEHLRYTQRQLAQQVQEVRQHLVNQAHAQQSQRLAHGFMGEIQRREESFRSEKPDYDEATTYLHDRRDRQLEAWGIRDPAQRQNILNNEMVFLASTALSQGKDPAALAYEAARRHGFGSPGRTPREDSDWKRGSTPEVTGESLLDLEGAEFDEAWGKLFRRAF